MRGAVYFGKGFRQDSYRPWFVLPSQKKLKSNMLPRPRLSSTRIGDFCVSGTRPYPHSIWEGFSANRLGSGGRRCPSPIWCTPVTGFCGGQRNGLIWVPFGGLLLHAFEGCCSAVGAHPI